MESTPESARRKRDRHRPRGGDQLGNPDLSDTWTWGGSSWTLASSQSAGAAAYAAGAPLDNVVLFGSNGTWAWNGATWSQLDVGGVAGNSYVDPSSAAPPASGMSAATVNGTMTMVGGWQSAGELCGTWMFIGSTWADVDDNNGNCLGPEGRSYFAATALGDALVLFGGETGTQTPTLQSNFHGTALGDTWTLNGTTWTQSSTSGPSARAGAVMATLGGKAVLFGGVAPGPVDAGIPSLVYFGDTWTWDGTTWTQVASTGPSPREFAGMAATGGQIVLFGGYGASGALGDTWTWDGTTWTQASTTGPSARYAPVMVGQ